MNQHPHKCGEESQCVTNQCHYTFFELTNQLWDTPTEHRDETFIPSHGIPIARFSVFVKCKPEKKKKNYHIVCCIDMAQAGKRIVRHRFRNQQSNGSGNQPRLEWQSAVNAGGSFFLKTGEVLLRKTDTELRLRGGNDVPVSGTGSVAERNTAPDGIARSGQIADRIPTADGENRTGNEFLRL